MHYSAEQRAAVFNATGGTAKGSVTHIEFLGLADVLRFNWEHYRPASSAILGTLGSPRPRANPRRGRGGRSGSSSSSGSGGAGGERPPRRRSKGAAEAALLRLGHADAAAHVAHARRGVVRAHARLALRCRAIVGTKAFSAITRAAAFANVVAACMWSVALQR